jgi:biopolymer transport protein ExbD
MAHVDTPARGGKRNVNASLNLVPYIDLLVTLMTFLMISAAWVSMKAITAQHASASGGSSALVIQPHTIIVDESSIVGLDQLASVAKGTPIQLKVADRVHHGRIIDVLDQVAAMKFGPATVEPLAAP